MAYDPETGGTTSGMLYAGYDGKTVHEVFFSPDNIGQQGDMQARVSRNVTLWEEVVYNKGWQFLKKHIPNYPSCGFDADQLQTVFFDDSSDTVVDVRVSEERSLPPMLGMLRGH